MNVLLTNDDGIASDGVRTLARLLVPWADVWVCVPQEQQSGASHGITVRKSLRVREEQIPDVRQAWSVDGRPADCVKLALLTLLPEPMDLVISGINEGANLGTDTLYSGTVAAAMEAALCGLPALALSLAVREKPWDFEPAAQVGVTLFQKWQSGALPIPPDSILNVNVPQRPAAEIRGYQAARLGVQLYTDAYHLQEETEDFRSYWLLGERIVSQDLDLSVDLTAVAQGYVALTPLNADRTDHVLLAEMERYYRQI